jgi:hypothetical protein
MSNKQLKIGDPDPGYSKKRPLGYGINPPAVRYSDDGNYVFVKGRWHKNYAAPVVELDKLFDRYE